MDNKVLDEAVEVARLAYEVEVDGQVYSPKVPADAMRAALLAGVKVLLGEPVGWMRTDVTYRGIDGRRDGERILSERRVYSNDTPVYAPDLGEGDGR